MSVNAEVARDHQPAADFDSPEDRLQSPLDEALEETFPASDPVAATAAASSMDDEDGQRADSQASQPAAQARHGRTDGAVRFPTSRRHGAGLNDDERPTLQLRSNAIQMLQADHAQLLLTAQKFRPRLSLDRKRSIADTACISLEIHLQLKEEIFYPALAAVLPKDHEALAQATGMVDELREDISLVRAMRPWDEGFDDQFLSLMNKALHCIADEETVLFPLAQSRMADQLDALGSQLSHRRMQLVGPHLAALTMNTMRTMPFAGLLAGAGAFAGGLLLARSLISRR